MRKNFPSLLTAFSLFIYFVSPLSAATVEEVNAQFVKDKKTIELDLKKLMNERLEETEKSRLKQRAEFKKMLESSQGASGSEQSKSLGDYQNFLRGEKKRLADKQKELGEKMRIQNLKRVEIEKKRVQALVGQ